MSEEETEIKRVPYGAISWYEQFLSLAQRIQVSKVDRDFLRTHKIGLRNEPKILSGLKALNLIDDEGSATENMTKLHVVGNAYKDNLKEIVLEGYSLLLSKIDLDKATKEDMINTIITECDASRRSATEAAKIFVFLADESGIEISEELEELRRKKKGKQRVSKPKKTGSKSKKKESKKEESIPSDVEGMHKIVWGDDIVLYLKKDDPNSAKTAITLIELYLNDLEEEL